MKHTLHKFHAKYVRDSLNSAVDTADKIHTLEKELTLQLQEIDKNRLYVRYGHKSLMGFCIDGLLFSRTQAYRIATQVRRDQDENLMSNFDRY